MLFKFTSAIEISSYFEVKFVELVDDAIVVVDLFLVGSKNSFSFLLLSLFFSFNYFSIVIQSLEASQSSGGF